MRTFVSIVTLMAVVSCGSSRNDPPAGASWYPEQILALKERQAEAATKLARVQDLLKREKLSGVWIRTLRNFAWVTAGGDSPIVTTGKNGAVSLFIRDDGQKFAIANTSEVARMRDEELKDMGYEFKETTWYADNSEANQVTALLRELTAGRPFGSDTAFPGSVMLDERIAALRVPLTDAEIRKYRWLGKRCAEAVDSVCRSIRPGMTERGIEALTSDALMRHAIRPAVIFIGADERILKYRQAPPSDTKKVEKYAMVNVSARRWGLMIAMTRFVHFGALPEELGTKLAAVARVNAGFWARTVPGAGAASIFEGAISDYAEVGYPEEWQMHSQGGAIGYQERDWLAQPGSANTIHENEAFAWNPSIQGIRIEDTILLVGDRLENLTEIQDWPALESKALGRIYRSPGILVR